MLTDTSAVRPDVDELCAAEALRRVENMFLEHV